MSPAMIKEHPAKVYDLSQGLCVHAGAGSGKTSCLVERYLAILDQKQSEVSRIVAITFTEKAAAEMKSRIRAAMEERCLDPARAPAARAHLAGLGSARIGTIHALCTGLLREYALEAGLDSQFRVLDAVQADILLQNSIRDHWRWLMEQRNPALMELMGDVEPGDIMDWMTELVRERVLIRERWHRLHAIDKSFILARWDKAQAEKPPEEPDQKRKKSGPDMIRWSETDDKVLRLTSLLLELFTKFVQAFESAKKNIRALDFEDLQMLALSLLEKKHVGPHIRQGIDFLLLDEFQDTDGLQEKIVEQLAPLSRVFVVGDPQQSIYGFRGADVSVFSHIQQNVKSSGDVLRLDVNYRSVPGILSFCNDLFAGLMAVSRRTYEICHQPLRPHRVSSQKGQPCVVAWKHRLEEKDKTKLDALRRREAEQIAQTLQDWKEGHSPLPHFYWRDAAILLRNMGSIYIYQRALEKRGIPFVTSSSNAFFAQQSVTDLINAMTAACNVADEMALAGFLRGPMVGMSDEALYRLRDKSPLWEGLATARDEEAVQARRWLEQWHHASGLVCAADLAQIILRDTGFEQLLLTQYLGRRKVALLQHVIHLASSYGGDTGFSTRDFIAYAKHLVWKERGDVEGPPLEETDAVSILTVHKAKGLEFPAVFLADLSYRPRNVQPDLILHEELGIGIKLWDEQGDEIKTIQRRLVEDERNRKEEAEAKRVLYVAATRAKDILVLSGIKPLQRIGKGTNPWHKWLLNYLDTPRSQSLVQVESICEATSTVQKNDRPISGPIPLGGETQDVSVHQIEKYWSLATADFRTLPHAPPRLSVSDVEQILEESSRRLRGNGSGSLLDFSAQQAGEERGAGAAFGSLVHRVLSRWNMRDKKALNHITDAALKENNHEPAAEKELHAKIVQLLGRFADSTCGRSLQTAQAIHREIPFVLPVIGGTGVRKPASGEGHSQETILIEGTIDCLYQDEGGAWAVLDYKTDDVPAEAVDARTRHYETQMKLYGAACMQILNLKEIRLELYFMRPEQLYQETFTDLQAQEFCASLRVKLVKTP